MPAPLLLPKFARGALFLLALGLAGRVHAQSDDDAVPEPGERAATAVDDGAFLPLAMSARSDAQRVLVSTQGGYDSALRSPQFSAAARRRCSAASHCVREGATRPAVQARP